METARTPPRQHAHPDDIMNTNRQSDARFALPAVAIANVAVMCTASVAQQPTSAG
jgi:hypothetical protein